MVTTASGDAKIDGFFQAVGTLQDATASVTGDFQGNILALATVYGIDVKGGFTAKMVDAVIAAAKANISANVTGRATVNCKPPACQASVDVAARAQAQCEVNGGCAANVSRATRP